jgi:hypothetical protein
MHPFLANKSRLGVYLLQWMPLAALLAFLLATMGRLSWPEAIALASPLILIYQFICLSPWYLCRVMPLSTPVARLIGNHIAAAAVAALVWMLIAKGLGFLLSRLFPGLERRVNPPIPMIFAVGVILYLLAVALYYVILSSEASRESETRAREARILAQEAELQALKAQINPHFLFNSLHSISALCTVDSTRARDMCIRLSEFLRSTLALGERREIPLGDELALANSYLGVERMRFGSRLAIAKDINPGCEDCMVPPLILQPLIENAVKHGVGGLVEGGTITLRAECEGDLLRIKVENEFDAGTPPKAGQGIGLRNVRGRLQARYGETARFYANTQADVFSVEIVLPCERAKAAAGMGQ